MSHPCQYNVYLHKNRESEEGGRSKAMIASFRDQVDAVNFAAEKSKGQYRAPYFTLVALDNLRHVFMKFREGDRI